jgi:hypothetical protein
MKPRLKELLAPTAIALLYFVMLVGAVWSSTPRRVGDGGDYLVMATRLAALQPPSLTHDELSVAKRELEQLGLGFETAPIEYPNLVGADGRQDFPHYWLYPLLVAPMVPAARVLDLHPNWAFTFTNLVLLTAAVFVIARHAGAAVVAAGFLSPVIWWADKAQTEVFLFSAISVSAVFFHFAPAASMVCYGLAGAQNTPIGLTFPVFAMFALAHANGARRAWISAAVGAAMVVSPFFYTWMRLGRLTPTADSEQTTWPMIRQLAAFVAEPNIGILANAPVYGLALIVGIWLALRPRPARPALSWWPFVIQIMLLVLWSQDPNMNHSGTPGVNRWTLLLLALVLPWLGIVYPVLKGVGRNIITGAIVVAAGWSAFAHLPFRPEQYLRPTRLAEIVWAGGWLDATPAEVFAERWQQREQPFVPMALDDCESVLVFELQWPLQCVPPDAVFPAHCQRAGSMCYAVSASDGRTRIVPTANNGFFFIPAVPSWPAAGPLAVGIRTLLLELDPTSREWTIEPHGKWIESARDADVVAILRRDRGVLLYVARTGPAAELRVRAGGFSAASIHTLMPVSTLSRSAAADDRVVVRLPPGATNVAVTLSSPLRYTR